MTSVDNKSDVAVAEYDVVPEIRHLKQAVTFVEELLPLFPLFCPIYF